MSKKQKLTPEEKAQKKAEKKANGSTPEAIETKQTVIKAATAVVCVIALCLSSTSAIGKYCEAITKAAEVKGTSVSASDGNVAGGSTDTYTDSSTSTGTGASDDTAAPADDTAANAGSTDATTPDSSSSSTDANTASKPGTPAKEITATSGLNSTDVNEVLKYYKLVAEKNKKKQGQYVTSMSLKDLNGGAGAVGSLVSAIKPIGEKALAKNSTAGDNIPGTLDKIQAADWQSAKAVNDGTYTTLTIDVKPQKDGPNGKSNEGTVGRSIGVLDGVQTALDEMGGVSADFASAKFELLYDHAYIHVKVKNATGELVKGSCEWHHQVNVTMDNLTVKVTLISATLKGASAVIDYSVKY